MIESAQPPEVGRHRHSAQRRMPRLSEAFNPSRNSLAFLRLLFAAMVLVDHAFPIGGFNHGTDPMWGWTGGQESMGGLAVAGFFIISGFLVTRSVLDSSSTLRYFWKRVLRIFPGFWVCLIVTIVVFAPLAYLYQHGNLHGYVHGFPDSPGRYVRTNFWLNMSQYNIDSLLGSTPYAHSGFPPAFDGSLWTLIYEFKCYIGLGILGLVGVVRHGRFAILALSVALWSLQLAQTHDPGSVGRVFSPLADPEMIRLAFLFSLGCVVYLHRQFIPISPVLAGLALIGFLVGMVTHLYPEIGQICFSYLVFWAAIRVPIQHADRYGDFSYGLYIYAFPVEQLAALHGLYRWGLVAYVLITMVVSLGFAVVSWHAIERPAMKLKKLPIPSKWAFWSRQRAAETT
jgi:peptidoglycan/LPS O-acetylase OafA/YrhL